jgi:hypothetical protein
MSRYCANIARRSNTRGASCRISRVSGAGSLAPTARCLVSGRPRLNLFVKGSQELVRGSPT